MLLRGLCATGRGGALGVVVALGVLGPLATTAAAAPPAPTVTGVSPAGGGVGRTTPRSTPVTITGTNFADGDTVMFGSVPGTSVTVVSPTTITALSPAVAAASTVDVTVTDASGQTSAVSSADEFSYTTCVHAGPAEVPLVLVMAPGPFTLDAFAFLNAADCLPANATVQWEVGMYGDLNGLGTFTPIPGATSSTLTIPSSSYALEGIPYEAVFSVDSREVASNFFVLTVEGPPEIATQPADASVPVGATATFSAATLGPAAADVQWESEPAGATTFTPIAGAASDTLTVSNATLAQSGTRYEAVFTDPASGDSTATNPAVLTVFVPPVVTQVAPNSGGPFSFVLIRGHDFSQVRSVRFGTRRTLFLALTSRLIIALAPPGGTGTVDVTVTTGAGGSSATSSADQFTYR